MRDIAVAALLLWGAVAAPPARAAEPADSAAPPALQQEVVAWLLPRAGAAAQENASAIEREETVRRFLARDPLPETGLNELAEGVDRRRRLVLREVLTAHDDRARLLFLLGTPDQRQVVDCSVTFRPLEIWRYGQRALLLFRPGADAAWRLWLPPHGKASLYTEQMEGWMEEWEQLRRTSQVPRLDRRLCETSLDVDRATGIDGLAKPMSRRVDARELLDLLAPPADLAAWARAAAATPVGPPPAALPIAIERVDFPRRRGQRLDVRMLLRLAPGAPLTAVGEGAQAEVRLNVEGVVETGSEVFERFRMRFPMPPPEAGEEVPLVVTRALRPGRYTVRLRVGDEAGGAETVLTRGVEVPRDPDESIASDPDAQSASARLDEQLARAPDALALLVPPRDVIFGQVRVQAVVAGPRIRQVTFLLDGEPQLTRTAPPYTVELDLPDLPRELVLRAEGHDETGALVAADEAVLNLPRGELEVTLVAPAAPPPPGPFRAAAHVTVPEERRVERLELRLNEGEPVIVATPPWEAELVMPGGEDLVFLTATAVLDDDSRAEAVRFLRDPYGGEQVDVELVELYTTVVDRSGGLVEGLEVADFTVWEDGRQQEIQRFERVVDLPLTVGMVLDVSGSMHSSLRQAQAAATEFLREVVGPQDQCFAVAFASEPALVMPRTTDVGAVAQALERVEAEGWTALHDAVVFSLYHFRGVRGRRALVLLSDGDDTDSRIEFGPALEYARQSGVVIYTIGLKTEALDAAARRKLRALARETGGQSFVIADAGELAGVYQAIEAELRRQYLIAYTPDRPLEHGTFRQVEVQVARRGAEARTIRGYYP